MNGEQISKALNHLPEDMLQEAMVPRKAIPWKRITAIAAVVAILLTALLWPRDAQTGPQLDVTIPSTELEMKDFIATAGVLKLYACSEEELSNVKAEEYVLIEGLEPTMGTPKYYKTLWSPYLSLVSVGATLTMKVEEESLLEHEIVFHITTNYGELYGDLIGMKYRDPETLKLDMDKASFGKHGVLNNGETIHWQGQEIITATKENTIENVIEELGNIYMYITVMADDHIVGYAVVEMVCIDFHMALFQATIVDSGYFPKIDGEFQNISEELVLQYIESRLTGKEM